jgi:hypothetical protein
MLVPSFFFVDPFGFSGFFTFMTRDINRFLGLPQVEIHLDVLYTTPEWREIYKMKE